ncbi:response regulator receiver protein [Halothece sp. PCC 7418]|uniref:response regulator n=1 Tax=Halothece sp. (strain PCC 7418) TaxID=65093 RepID=UPI0002A074F9|nr:response regulator [Halothece sp. PCC 7418]AFZ45450.1 response regulator receiver protein [Halothece sp. PCC 7418]
MSDHELSNSSEFLATEQVTGQIHDSFQLLKDLSNRSGVLEVFRGDVNWIIYLKRGQIQFASMSVQSLEELDYHLHYLGCKKAREGLRTAKSVETTQHSLADMPLDSIIHWLGREEFLNAKQISQVTEKLSREALEPLLWLQEGEYSWQESESTEPLISIVPHPQLATLIEEFRDRLASWQKLVDKIGSPHQRPYFFNQRAVDSASNPNIAKLSKLMRGYSIHQLAIYIKQDEIKLARMLYPYIGRGEIFLREPKSAWRQLPTLPKLVKPETQNQISSRASAYEKTIKIACVDDSPTILREVQRLLGDDKYEITKIENPIEAAAILFRIQPDLVLMDISMPEINGYKLCSLLRNSNALSEVPIIMVTSRTGVIDKVRAKTVGATDYLTKPFTKASLLQVVEKHLS